MGYMEEKMDDLITGGLHQKKEELAQKDLYYKLFTLCSDRLPTKDGEYYTDQGQINFSGGRWYAFEPIYWLDPDGLTTIEAAKELAENAYKQGKIDYIENYNSNGIIDLSFDNFITDNLKNL